MKKKRFDELVKEAAGCTLCPAMCGRSAVLSELNGSVDARIMFIGEAPGRKGADRTRVPFSGDQSGANLDRFLGSINLTRPEIFITSSALTSMSPLQYQKMLRLQTARERMLMDGLDATTAAYEVGYESISQFSREYSRFFGLPPIRDVKALKNSNTTLVSVA